MKPSAKMCFLSRKFFAQLEEEEDECVVRVTAVNSFFPHPHHLSQVNRLRNVFASSAF